MKKTALLSLLCALALLSAGCQRLDVIGTASVAAFEELLSVVPAESRQGYWSLEAPDGEARFLWSTAFDADQEITAMLELDAGPFVAAGLDTALLPEGMLQGETIVVGTRLDIEPGAAGSPLGSYERLLWGSPDSVGHHMAMDHFGIDLGHGYQFEWARHMDDNDKDMVFVLDPDPFRQAGADVGAIAGWILDDVETMDHNGSTVVVEKLLKPFDLL